MEPSERQAAARKWTRWRVVSYTFLVAGAYVLAQLGVVFAVTSYKVATEPAFDREGWSRAVGTDGLVFPLCLIAAAVVCVPLVRFLASRSEPAAWWFLGVRACRWQSLLLWCLVMLVFMALTDLLLLILGRPLVPDFMVKLYAGGRFQALLIVAMALAAPVVEELFFRGFLLSALDALGLGFRRSALVVSAAWAALHLQHGLYEVAVIFAMGLLLAEARYRSGSVLPCMAMHGLNNLGSYIETAILAG